MCVMCVIVYMDTFSVRRCIYSILGRKLQRIITEERQRALSLLINLTSCLINLLKIVTDGKFLWYKSNKGINDQSDYFPITLCPVMFLYTVYFKLVFSDNFLDFNTPS